MSETTLVLLKPDSLQRDLVGQVITRFEQKGLQLVGMKMFRFTPRLLSQHYAHVVGEPFYEELELFMTSGPSIAVAISGPGAVQTVRGMIGSTRGHLAMQGTVRGDFAMSAQRNIVHASDSLDSAKIELVRFFSSGEIFRYSDKLSSSVYSETDRFDAL